MTNTTSLPTATPRDDDWFTDVTAGSGVDFTYRNGREAERYYLIESFGGGVALVDFDLDGDPDLCFAGGGTFSRPPDTPQISGLPLGVYRNAGHFQFVDVARQSGLVDAADYSFGCTATDADGDGFPDLFVSGYGHSRLYHNQGDGTFHEWPAAGQLAGSGMWTAAAWADVDHDGLPDLFLARYVDWSPEGDVVCRSRLGTRDLCGPNSYAPTTALFFHNRGDGGFDDWSERVGLKDGVKGLGLVAGDFDGDGWIDFYLANDELANHLYWGTADGTLRESGWEAGVAASELGMEEGSMGVSVGDVDGDGRPDLWVVNYEHEDNSLYQQRSPRQFEHVTARLGLAGALRQRVAWGTSLTDFDGDGWLDIVVLNGHAVYFSDGAPFEQFSQLFRNQRGQRFENRSEQGGTYFRQPHAARGCAVGDLDGDGAPDLVAVHVNAPVRLLHNQQTPASFVAARLRGTAGARDAIGAHVRLANVAHPAPDRFVIHGAGYASYSDDQILYGLEQDVTAVDLIVDWPGRSTERFSGLAPRTTHVLVEGQGVRDESR